ncbi:hypothetical protein [Hymenobacter sp. B81]|uniref:chryseobasin-related MNIO class RiPP peptide n=1 Tax=Hymenobacter sp. B81 TaxID=3344878 RepID=UPI0037DD899C
MKLPKAVLGAVLIGLTVHTTSCDKKDAPAPKGEQGDQGKGSSKGPEGCPACGMG